MISAVSDDISRITVLYGKGREVVQGPIERRSRFRIRTTSDSGKCHSVIFIEISLSVGASPLRVSVHIDAKTECRRFFCDRIQLKLSFESSDTAARTIAVGSRN